jgi:hypothetical protein
MGYMNTGVMWFVSCKDCGNTTEATIMPPNYLLNATIGIDSTFYTYSSPVLDNSGDSTVKIYESYMLMNNWKKKQWGIWSSVYGLEVTQVTIWERRGDLSGVVLRCASASVSITRLPFDYGKI